MDGALEMFDKVPLLCRGTYREKEPKRSEKDTVYALGVDALGGANGPDVEEHSAEDHEANKKEQAEDAIPCVHQQKLYSS